MIAFAQLLQMLILQLRGSVKLFTLKSVIVAELRRMKYFDPQCWTMFWFPPEFILQRLCFQFIWLYYLRQFVIDRLFLFQPVGVSLFAFLIDHFAKAS